MDNGLTEARVGFSGADLLEIAYPATPDQWTEIPGIGQIRIIIRKGDNLIHFRQKAGTRMPTSGRRTIRVNLLPTCSDCWGADLVPASDFQQAKRSRTLLCLRRGKLPVCRSRKNTGRPSAGRLPETHHVHSEQQRLSYVGELQPFF